MPIFCSKLEQESRDTLLDRTPKIFLGIAAAVMVAGVAAISTFTSQSPAKGEPQVAAVNAAQPQLHPVHIRQPAGRPTVLTARTNFHGQPVSVSCSTCHATARPNPGLRHSAELEQFHQGLKFNHGQLSCLSCHNSGDYDTLRMADGAALEFSNLQQLCAQCHGPQARDYKNGSHGGMSGYWDLSRGPRTRNNCTDCHDPHSPQYPVMTPVFPPAPTSKNKSPEENH